MVVWGYFSIKRTIRDMIMIFRPNRKQDFSKLSEKEKDDLLKMYVFGKMTIEQKYAYVYTMELFYTFADNVRREKNDAKQTSEEESQNMIAGEFVNYGLNLLSLKTEDVDSAIKYFDDRLYLSPQDYLKEIKDKSILDSLLYICSKIADTKKGVYNGKDINKMAKDFLNDFFGELGYTSELLDQTISKIDVACDG